MNWIKKHKEIFLQILVFTSIGFFFHKKWILYYATLLVIILPFKKISEKYILLLNVIINQIGVIIKTVLFVLLFILIILPIALILKLKKKENTEGYIINSKTINHSTFIKMW